MSATVIAFPMRPSRRPNDYAWMAEVSRRLALEQKTQGLWAEATPVKAAPDNHKELLALLRRIDRRLAKMAVPGSLARQAAGG